MFKFFKNNEIKIAQQAVENNPDNILKLNILGKLYLENKFYNEAVAVFEKILKIDENFLPTLESLSKCYILQKQYLKAFRTLKYLNKLNPEDMHAKTMLFSLENVSCETEAKIEIIKGLLEFEEKDSLYEKLGEYYLQSGQFTKSAIIFEKLCDKEEKSLYLVKLAEIYEKTNKIKKAAESLEKLMLTEDFDYEYAQKLAGFYILEQRFEEAKEIYMLLKKAVPKKAVIFNEKIAEIQLLENNPDAAIKTTQAVIEEDKYSVEAKFLQAQALLDKKDYPLLIEFLREFYCDPVDEKTEKKIEQKIIDACILYSQELREAGKFLEAIDALMPALRYDENNKNIYIELSRISAEIKDYSAAKEYMKIAESL